MKANFKIDDKNFNKEDTKENDEKTSYEKHLNTLPKGWNLWSLRTSEKKVNE